MTTPPSLQPSFSSSELLHNDSEDEDFEDEESIFWNSYKELLLKRDFPGLFALAGKYKSSLEDVIQFKEPLQNAISLAKTSDDFDAIRRIATIDQIFNPTTDFPRLIQALCYFKVGNEKSAYSILENVGNANSKICKIKHLSPEFQKLLIFFLKQKKEGPEVFLSLKV